MFSDSSTDLVAGPEFLGWLRSTTEDAWTSHTPRDFQAAGVGGLDWAPGTRWRGGLSEAEITAAERSFGLAFPPDYRRFLGELHTTDPEQIGAFYQGQRLVPQKGRRLHDWSGDPEPIRAALAWPLEGLLWSIEADKSWHPKWGERPDSAGERATVVRKLVEQGPPLIPVYHHRYLVGDPLVEGNPVLSMFGADVIVYANDLESYLAVELTGRPWRAGRDRGRTVDLGIWSDVIDGF